MKPVKQPTDNTKIIRPRKGKLWANAISGLVGTIMFTIGSYLLLAISPGGIIFMIIALILVHFTGMAFLRLGDFIEFSKEGVHYRLTGYRHEVTIDPVTPTYKARFVKRYLWDVGKLFLWKATQEKTVPWENIDFCISEAARKHNGYKFPKIFILKENEKYHCFDIEHLEGATNLVNKYASQFAKQNETNASEIPSEIPLHYLKLKQNNSNIIAFFFGIIICIGLGVLWFVSNSTIVAIAIPISVLINVWYAKEIFHRKHLIFDEEGILFIEKKRKVQSITRIYWYNIKVVEHTYKTRVHHKYVSLSNILKVKFSNKYETFLLTEFKKTNLHALDALLRYQAKKRNFICEFSGSTDIQGTTKKSCYKERHS